MTTAAELLKAVPLFAGLSDDDLQAICEGSEDVELAPGEQLFAEGDTGDRAYVVVEGEVEVVKQSADRDVLLAVRGSGEVIGEMALIEHSPRSAAVRAKGPVKLMAIRKDQLEYLLETSLSATRAMFYTILARWRGTEAMLRQGEKMAQLGTLTAGVAHELNNPAAAVRRGADQITDAISRFAEARGRLGGADFTEDELEKLEAETTRAMEIAARPPNLDALDRSDREEEVEAALEDANVENSWELASPLASLGYDADAIADLSDRFGDDKMTAVANVLATAYDVYNLLAEIGQGAGRISEIVKALKSYSYLDQAPVQEVDVHEGIDDTLLILRSKLKEGVVVRRAYGELPRIQAHGSELNQVWTNLLDNAIDALDGEGQIDIRTSVDDGFVVVEIEDHGAGIPEDIQGRVFDAFFTTKPPGKGTGMGLDITYNIVVYKHNGAITLESEPGKTVFTVRLPVDG
jgi:signal transduction histidine kinase